MDISVEGLIHKATSYEKTDCNGSIYWPSMRFGIQRSSSLLKYTGSS